MGRKTRSCHLRWQRSKKCPSTSHNTHQMHTRVQRSVRFTETMLKINVAHPLCGGCSFVSPTFSQSEYAAQMRGQTFPSPSSSVDPRTQQQDHRSRGQVCQQLLHLCLHARLAKQIGVREVDYKIVVRARETQINDVI